MKYLPVLVVFSAGQNYRWLIFSGRTCCYLVPSLWMEDKMAAGAFGCAMNYGWDNPYYRMYLCIVPDWVQWANNKTLFEEGGLTFQIITLTPFLFFPQKLFDYMNSHPELKVKVRPWFLMFVRISSEKYAHIFLTLLLLLLFCRLNLGHYRIISRQSGKLLVCVV